MSISLSGVLKVRTAKAFLLDRYLWAMGIVVKINDDGPDTTRRSRSDPAPTAEGITLRFCSGDPAPFPLRSRSDPAPILLQSRSDPSPILLRRSRSRSAKLCCKTLLTGAHISKVYQEIAPPKKV